MCDLQAARRTLPCGICHFCWCVRLCSTGACLGLVKVCCLGSQTLILGLCLTGGAPHSALWYLAIYAGVSGFQIVFQLSSTLLLKILSLAAARSMHNSMLKALLRLVFSTPVHMPNQPKNIISACLCASGTSFSGLRTNFLFRDFVVAPQKKSMLAVYIAGRMPFAE